MYCSLVFGMNGFSSVSTLLINTEVDSMGGVIDGGAGIGTKTSPRRAAIEKAQAELRLEYDVREERKRELEFLERGGNPLDFKFGHPSSLSVQSTSLSEHADHILISDAKGSFALTASPPGDSVESIGRPGITIACEPNSADNFDGENELRETARKSKYSKCSMTPEHSSQLDGNQNAGESEDSPIFHPKRGQAYRRRNRSRTARDGSRSSSTDVASRGGQSTLLANSHGTNAKAVNSDDRLNLELVGTNANDSTSSVKVTMPDGTMDPSTNSVMLENQCTGNISGAASEKSDSARGSDLAVPAGTIGPPPAGAEKVENHDSRQQLSEPENEEENCAMADGLMSRVGVTTKGLDSESSCAQTSLSVDVIGKKGSQLCDLKLVDSNGASKGEAVAKHEVQNGEDDKIIGGKDVMAAAERGACTNDNHNSVVENPQGNGFMDVDEKEMHRKRSAAQNGGNCSSYVEELESKHHAEPRSRTGENSAELNDQLLQSSSPHTLQDMRDSCEVELTNAVVSGPRPAPELPTSSEDQLKATDKAHEDKILAETRIIEAKHKRIAELSLRPPPADYRKKSHWDFVVEEMAWLANDFAQERLWKITASAQICHRVAFASRLRSMEKDKLGQMRNMARTLANAIMEFWHSAELLLQDDGISPFPENSKLDAAASEMAEEVEIVKGRSGGADKELGTNGEQRLRNHGKKTVPVLQYAARFLQCNSSVTSIVSVGAPDTSDLASDMCMPDMSWQDHYTEQNLFYLVPPGSMEIYRRTIESSLVCSEKKGNNQRDDAEGSMYDAGADFGSQENEYEEDEAESVSYLPGAFEGSRSLKIVQKKRKTPKSYAARSYGFGADYSYGNCVENRVGAPQSGSPGKRPMNSLNVGPIPTKRMRTASRQRIVGPFSMGGAGGVPTPTRNDATSSGDTNSFQDDQGMLHGGCMIQKVTEVESVMDFDKQSIYDPTDVPAKPKKKKKAKHQASSYDQRWTVESVQNEQRDNFKKRLAGHQYETNGSTGLFVHHAKKQKLIKQSYENSFENTLPVSGSITSPAASQMSNMSNPNKLTKFVGGRDQVRKVKLSKVPIRQPGSGGEWTLYEDQALVVLVHDMGPNWELVSDAFNSTLLFKCVFRRPDECKKRHKTLMDGPSGDGADSADDSGSSQPYQSTLPGIPKGSARQLFRQLQGPLEEDTIKSHFEKISVIGSRLAHRKKQNDNQDPKQIAPVHGSHVAALSQVIPNNVNGGVLTPLDLCDVSGLNPDVFPLVSQPAAGLASPSQGVLPLMLPPGGNASLQNSPGMGMGGSLSPAHPNGPTRDGRFSVPRTSLPNDELQRVQQYNNMLPDRSIQQSNMSTSPSVSGADRNMRVIPGGGMGRMPGMNRSMTMQRPDFQGIASSSMSNSGTMLGMPSNTNMHSGAGVQGNSKLRPGDSMHLARPNQSMEHRRQMMSPEMQMQVTQANSQGVPAFGGLSSPASIPLQNFPVHHQHQHLNANSQHPHFRGPAHPSAEQQAYMRVVRHQQQRMLQRQQQQQQLQSQYPAGSAVMVHGQTQSHIVMSSPLQNNSQIQSPSSSQLVSSPALAPSSPLTPTSQQQNKHNQLPHHSHGRNSQSGMSGVINQTGNQKQRQPPDEIPHQQLQQSGRHQPPQRQQSQSLQQAKRVKGMGRGNSVMHQNVPLDPSHLNGLSTNQVNQAIEKGEQPKHLMQGHGVYPGSKPLVPPQHSGSTQSQRKSSSAPLSAKQFQQNPFHPEASNQSQVPSIPSAVGVPASTQSPSPSVMPSHSRQLQGRHHPPVKLVNKSQTVAQRSTQQSQQPRSNQVAKSQYEEAQPEQEIVDIPSGLGTTSEAPTTCVESSNQVPLTSYISTVSVLSSSPRAGPTGSPLIPASSGNELLPAVSKSISQRQLPENLPPLNNVGQQWQQQHSNSQKQSQQQQQLEQLPQKQQLSQQQIQTGQSSSRVRSADPVLEG